MSCRLLVAPERLAPGTLELTGDDHHYLFRVRRLRAGDGVLLCDGQGREADAEVEAVNPASGRLRVGEARAAAPATHPHFTVLLALIKGERMDGCITRLTELGVDRIVPVAAARSVVTLEGDKARSRRERYQRLVVAAAQQCRRADLPEVTAVATFAEALALSADAELKLLFWEGAHAQPLAAALPDRAPPRVALLTGPEGGFEDAEVTQAEAIGFRAVGLGPRILRAETAPVAALAILGFALGDLAAESDVEP